MVHRSPSLTPLDFFLQGFYLHLGWYSSQMAYCHAASEDSLNCNPNMSQKTWCIQLYSMHLVFTYHLIINVSSQSCKATFETPWIHMPPHPIHKLYANNFVIAIEFAIQNLLLIQFLHSTLALTTNHIFETGTVHTGHLQTRTTVCNSDCYI
jgi:hypothetical protein